MVAGEIPADVVLQTDRVFAFRDINPQAPTHVLVIPKDHHATAAALAAADAGLLGEVVAGCARGRAAGGPGHRRRHRARLPPGHQHRPAGRPVGAPRALPRPRRTPDGVAARLTHGRSAGVMQAGPMTDTAAPVRIERDGDVAVVVLDNPPLNLFTPAVFQALDAVVKRTGRAHRPAAGRTGPGRCCSRPAARSSPAASTSPSSATSPRDPSRSPAAASSGRSCCGWPRPIEDLPVPTVFAAHGLTLTAAFELVAVLRHPAGRREGVVRARGDRRRAHAVDGRAAAAGRARRPRAGARADLHRRALPGRGAGAVERRQPGAARRGLRRGRPRLRPPGGRRPDGRPRGDQAAGRHLGRATAPGPPTRWCPRSPVPCSPPPTCAAPWRPSWPTAPGRRPTRGGDPDGRSSDSGVRTRVDSARSARPQKS